MNASPTPEDAEQLRKALQAALSAKSEVRYAGGYPIYPEAFRDFTGYISGSPWHRADYIKHMNGDLRAQIEELPLGKVRSFLTMMIRIDRFSPGGLLAMLEDGTAERIVSRAVELSDD
ncbi:MAG: DUF6508 domain-containing protein [Verrucomicrobiales bacterium]|nr:DUF6508 domain-containing protein [Verrucomicrobiales bacterium]